MPDARKRPCSICRHWFRPDPRVGKRQRACPKPECQAARRKQTQARWRSRNRDYGIGHRIQKRNAREPPPAPLQVPAPLDRLPWDVAKDQFGGKGADFIGVAGRLLLRSAKDQFRAYLSDLPGLPGILPAQPAKDQRPAAPY